jgi:hypothetical protein
LQTFAINCTTAPNWRTLLLAFSTGDDDRNTHPLSLARHYVQVYSQNGEDGMLAEIFIVEAGMLRIAHSLVTAENINTNPGTI